MKYKYTLAGENVVLEDQFIEYLDMMSKRGWKLKSIGYFLFKFEKCFQPCKYQMDYNELNEEYLSVLKEAGYEYVGAHGIGGNVFVSENINALDLHTDENLHRKVILEKYSQSDIVMNLIFGLYFALKFYGMSGNIDELIKGAYLCLSLGFVIEAIAISFMRIYMNHKSKLLLKSYQIMTIMTRFIKPIFVMVLLYASFYVWRLSFQIIMFLSLVFMISIGYYYFSNKLLKRTLLSQIKDIILLSLFIYVVIFLVVL